MIERPAAAGTGTDAPRAVPPAAGAAPQQVADLLRTFSAAAPGRRRRRRDRAEAPATIVPLLVAPPVTPLDPSRIEAARARLKAQSLVAKAADADGPRTAPAVDPGSFDAARTRLRGRARRTS